MAIAASMLRTEMRRHMLMNVALVASCVVGGTVVTNERGLFVPISFHGVSAFAAMFTQSHLLPDNTGLTDVRMVSPLDPFEVTADSRDLRRRLMDSLSWLPEQASEYNKELAQVSNQMLTPTELASAEAPQAAAGAPGAGDAGSAASPASAQQQQQQQANILPTTNNSATQTSSDLTPSQVAAASQAPAADPAVAAVPEPSAWAMLIAGFGMIGYLLRSSRKNAAAAARQEPQATV